MPGAEFIFFVIKVNPVVQTDRPTTFQFTQKHMFKTRTANFATASSWIHIEPNPLQKIKMTRPIFPYQSYKYSELAAISFI